MPLTLSEKILSAKAGRTARAGDLVVCEVDLVLGTDASTPMALDYFARMGGTSVRNPHHVLLARDHYAPPTSDATRGFHDRMQGFADRHGLEILPVGGGISHQVAVESGRVRPGDLVIGADSHTVSCGAVGAFATGVGSADLAAALLTGKVWLRVPQTIRVELRGVLPPGTGAKDIVLALLARLGTEGATYASLEFTGPVATTLPVDERLVLSNMAVEMGAKAGLFGADSRTGDYLAARGGARPAPLESDPGASFVRELTLDVSELEPLVALPHDPANVVPVTQALGTPVDMVFLGTCTGGRAHDFRAALRMLDAGGGIADGVAVVVTPASEAVRAELERDGTLARLEAHGAQVTTTGCGPCCGTSGPIPANGATVLSTANRNFKARMGNPTASIILASPATCAAAATAGRIVDPRALGEPGAGP